MKLPPSPFRRALLLLAATAALSLNLPGTARAAVLTWDTANVTSPGTWNTTNTNFLNSVPANVSWNNANGDVARFAGSLAAAYTINLGTAITADSVEFDNSGSSSYNIVGGGNILTITSGKISVNTRAASIQGNIGGTNGLTKSGTATLTLFSANSYTGATVIQSGVLQTRSTGALPAATTLTIGDSTLNATATLDVRANQSIAGIGTAGSGASSVTNTQVVGTTTLTINPDGAGGAAADSTFSGVLRDGDATHFLALTKTGSRTLTLAGVNTYTGATTVSGGTLLVNGSLGASAVTVASAGTFGGSGTVTGSVDVSGRLAAGNSIGTLNTGALNLGTTSTLAVELGRSGSTPLSDRVNVTGTVALASGSNLELTLFGGLTAAQAGDILWLISNDGVDGVTGAFTKLNGVNATLAEGSQFTWNSQEWRITYQANFESLTFIGGNDVAIQAVPEPGATAPLIALTTGLLLIRRRRRPCA